jgi:putative FmdB family regulatory protein
MPIHDYQCRSCGSTFESFVRLPNASSDREETLACPSCHGTDLERLVSGFAVNSDGTRQMHLNQARKRAQKEHRDKKHAEMEAMMHHDD